MTDKMFKELVASVREMSRVAKGKKLAERQIELEDAKIKEIREQTGLSQTHFANLIGVSRRTLENWEQGRRSPTGPARALLKIVESDPKGAVRALHG